MLAVVRCAYASSSCSQDANSAHLQRNCFRFLCSPMLDPSGTELPSTLPRSNCLAGCGIPPKAENAVRRSPQTLGLITRRPPSRLSNCSVWTDTQIRAEQKQSNEIRMLQKRGTQGRLPDFPWLAFDSPQCPTPRAHDVEECRHGETLVNKGQSRGWTDGLLSRPPLFLTTADRQYHVAKCHALQTPRKSLQCYLPSWK